METTNQKHWEEVYATKDPDQVSWTQKIPKTSLDFIHSFNLPREASIIDVGGGDSTLVDFLLDAGYQNITVLDISGIALDKAKKRLGDRAIKVNWVVSDITTFQPETSYDLWHDRAAFHFLTGSDEVTKYLNTAKKSVKGFMVMGSFSEQGPQKCSGLHIKQYSEQSLTEALEHGFEKIRCINEDHVTPFGTTQNFLFCSFKRASD